MKKTATIALAAMCAIGKILTSCQEPRYIKTSGEIQGTFYNITYKSSENLDSLILTELNKFNKSLSIFDAESTISRINNNEDVNPEADTVFMKVFDRAMEVSRETDGAFDITVSPIVKLWGFNHATPQEVTQAKIDSVMAFVGYDKIRIENGKAIKTDPRVQLDANAIAQGYSCDVIADFLEQHGVENYMIEIGGEIRAKGVNGKGDYWRIGITKPRDDSTATNEELQDIMWLDNKSVGTSGNYHKYRIVDGKKIGHEIDPKTGRTAENELLSASIIADDCISADAYATACMVLGLDKSLELCRKNGKIEGYFIYLDKDGKERMTCTDGFRKRLKTQNQNN